MLPESFLFTHSNKNIDYAWQVTGRYKLSLEEMLVKKNNNADIYNYMCYGRSSYLFIGYAENRSFETDYPVFYNLRDGKVYLGYINSRACTMANRYFRNSLDTAIHYKIKLDAVPNRKELNKKDQRIDLSCLEAVKINKKIPCKLLAWIYHGSGNSLYLHPTCFAPLPNNATLLVACGNQIVLTNRAELNSLIARDKIELLIDCFENKPTLEVVYIGNTGDDPRRISYIPNKGIACNYTGLDYLYLDGTFDATPNVAYGTQNVIDTCFIPEDRGTITNLPCYTDIDLRDSKISASHALWDNNWLFCFGLERLVCPRHYSHLEIMATLRYFSVFHNIQELILPEALVSGPYLYKCPSLKTLQCPSRIISDLYGESSFYAVFPNIETINNQEAQSFLQDLSACRLLNGLDTLNIGDREAERAKVKENGNY